MSRKPRILVLTLSFGAGHVSAAQNVVAEFQKQIPEADLRLLDALKNCSLSFRVFYVWTYWAVIRYAPRVWEKFFNLRLERRDEQTAPVWIWRAGCRKVFDEIQNFQPDLIIAAEVGACEIAVIARRENLTNAEIVNVITDFEAEPIWVKPEISAFAVAAEEVKKQLENWGASAEKIKVCGIPLSRNFAEKHDAEKIKTQFGLDARPIILLMGGGMGPTRMNEVAARLLENGKNLQIVALPAKDEKTKVALEKLRDAETVSLRVVGWTNSIAELMRTAKILATKPGGLTLSEAAACGLPLVLFDPIPGPEEANAARFAQAGAAVSTKNSRETAFEILRLLRDGEKLEAMSASCLALARPNAAREIVELALRKINLSNERNKIRFPPKKLSASRRAFAVWRKLKRRENFRAVFSTDLRRKKSVENFKQSSLEVKI
ncbi:MAG: MGDG synthase family glycosyltransferase [Pyrinomonadaceae bacterium]